MDKEKKYFDLQVNGYAGIDLNDEYLSIDDLRLACDKLAEDKVEGILATLITDDLTLMKKRISNIIQFKKEDPVIEKIIAGLHIEGPFLNSTDGYRGAHPEEFVREADVKIMEEILDAGDGLIKLVTLAPEVDPGYSVIKMLHQNNVTVSAGHSDASLDTLKGAVDAGLSMFTHLGNGCPKVIERHDNIIERVLSLSDDLWICFIADGHHIPFYALSNYIKSAGYEKTIVVTDAMAAASAPPGRYRVGVIEVEVGEDKIVRQPGRNNLAGSAVTMKGSANNLFAELKMTEDKVELLTSINPKRALGLID
ncbi:N-acetylglucosamine-6-phosphate deacetylase [hydrothermal vent metagenome]|uniref:N-acetylglucosamine-6-phosphate deacetylase n=1 Tax=hydrothermal vent metagenome TaxID=652676 RepID=A0A3B1CXG1_9ZZZZ